MSSTQGRKGPCIQVCKGLWGQTTMAPVSGIAACSVSRLLCTHWSPPGTLFLPLPSARHPGNTTVIPLRTCLLSELMGIDSLALVLLLARFYKPLPMTFMFSLFNSHHLARSVPTAHTHKPTGRCFCSYMCTHRRVYTLTSLRENLNTCRCTSFLLQEHEFW